MKVNLALARPTYDALSRTRTGLRFMPTDVHGFMRNVASCAISPHVKYLNHSMKEFLIDQVVNAAEQIQALLKRQHSTPTPAPAPTLPVVVVRFATHDRIEVFVSRTKDTPLFKLADSSHITGIRKGTLETVEQLIQEIFLGCFRPEHHEREMDYLIEQVPTYVNANYDMHEKVTSLLQQIKAHPRPQQIAEPDTHPTKRARAFSRRTAADTKS